MTNFKNTNTQINFGYTLIEVLIYLSIIGLLFSVGYASFRDFSRRQELSGAIKLIQGDLRLAQENASSGQKPESCSNLTSLDGFEFIIASNTEYKIRANCIGLLNAVEIKNVLLPSGIIMATSSINPLKFKVLGQGTNLGEGSTWVLTLTQTATGKVENVTVTSGGEIK